MDVQMCRSGSEWSGFSQNRAGKDKVLDQLQRNIMALGAGHEYLSLAIEVKAGV
jgi:hypothetical protein